MKKPVIITGLDIGSSKVSAVSVQLGKDGSSDILAQTSCQSKGISRGAFRDLNEAVNSVSRALAKLGEKVTKQGLTNIYANISGETIKAERSKGMIPLSVRGREITRADVDRCVNVASTIQLSYDRDIIHKIVHSFSIDDQPSIKNPLGLYASRLACEMYVITADINSIQNIYKCVNEAGYDVKEVVFSGIADGMSLLSSQEREEGAIIIDIGSSLTEISYFSGGVLSDLEILPVGAEDFNDDIKNSPILNDLLIKVKTKTEEFDKKAGKMNNIILTGGIAFSDGVIELLEEKISHPVEVGIVKGLKGDISGVDSLRLTTAIGITRYAEEKFKTSGTIFTNTFQHVSNKIVEIFNNYF